LSDSVAAALAQARALGLERLDAQLLLAHRLQRPRAWLLAHDSAPLSAEQQQAYLAGCQRRADGEPLAYLLSEREFHGLMLQVSPAVLVPRPDTETLVDWALELLATPLAAKPEVADLGTGSGAIALALKHRHPAAHVSAVECSAPALEVARANAAHHRLQVEWQLGSWWQPLAGRRFHLVASNPPYVAEDDPHLAALRHEPALALTPGGNGLSALAQIARGAPAHLHDAGWLLLEHGHEQADAVCRLLTDAGFEAVQTRADLAGRPRCSGGRRAATR
jgi:release factor glutamine methyltransferase